MRIKRRKTRIVRIGDVAIGGTHPVTVQSMTKTKTAGVAETVRQIKELQTAGCEIVRLAVKDSADAQSFKKIKPHVRIPLVADIHFDWRLAVEAIESGADKIRLNPGNIKNEGHIRNVVAALKSAKVPLRIGVNSGSVGERGNKRLTMADRLVRGALYYVKLIEKMKFYDIVISLKASNVLDTVEAYRAISSQCDYPLHLGVTATGTPYSGAIKSAVALGILLSEGIGDTLRVSLTDKPQQEVYAAQAILESLELRRYGQEIISCPTCGRCEVDLVRLVRELEARAGMLRRSIPDVPLKVAVMGCVVNGPGEAQEADIGIAFGKKEGLLFKKGKAIKKIPFDRCVDILIKEIRKEAYHAKDAQRADS